QKAIAGRDNTMLVQGMEEFLEDIDGFCGYRRGVLGLSGEKLPGGRVTAPIVAQRQDQMVLLESRALIEWTPILKRGGWEVTGEDIREVLVRLRKLPGNKDVFGFEIAQLHNKSYLSFDSTKLLEGLLLGLR